MSYRHPALRAQAAACAVYDDWPILGAKLQKVFVNKGLYDDKYHEYINKANSMNTLNNIILIS